MMYFLDFSYVSIFLKLANYSFTSCQTSTYGYVAVLFNYSFTSGESMNKGNVTDFILQKGKLKSFSSGLLSSEDKLFSISIFCPLKTQTTNDNVCVCKNVNNNCVEDGKRNMKLQRATGKNKQPREAIWGNISCATAAC